MICGYDSIEVDLSLLMLFVCVSAVLPSPVGHLMRGPIWNLGWPPAHTGQSYRIQRSEYSNQLSLLILMCTHTQALQDEEEYCNSCRMAQSPLLVML